MERKTFENKNAKFLPCCLTTLRKEGTSRVCVLSFPTICSPLPSRVDANNYPHLHGLKLDEYSDSEDSIDVLIGSDYYWDFATNEIVRGDFGPTAVNSKFGWSFIRPNRTVISQETTVTNLTIAEIATACLITPKILSLIL